MAGTGVGFAALRAFWPLFVVAVIGTLNPSGGDVSVFLPVEQAVLAEVTHGGRRTAAFARYNLAGALAAGAGALLSGVPDALGRRLGTSTTGANRVAFLA